ncbi:MAG TPA: penicillin-binding protein 2, partial [Solibacterales bacterium]|nr:penicillin-binding protein 2 [Bryobacterales bacterium]
AQPESPAPPHGRFREDKHFASGKVAVFQYATVAVFLFLIAGFWELQVQNEDVYHERAEKNRIKSVPILAPRGKILDRDGRVIVDNKSSFSLLLSRENLNEEHLKPIAEGLDLDYGELAARLRRFRKRPKYEPIVIKEALTAGQLAFVESHREAFPEMEIIEEQRRLYPASGLAAHLIGYVGEVSETELNSLEFTRFDSGDIVGKFGLERQYNDTLMGVDGQRRVIVDSRGNQRQVFSTKEAVPGRSLQLTIDLDLQVVAELAMENRRGAVVAYDPRNGEILAMVSRPAFDPNKFAGRIRPSDWREIMDNPYRPMLNRAIQAQLAPGSTFKPIMALAGLETGTIDESFAVSCGGGATFYGRYFKCHEKKGHGRVSLHRAMAQSCDVYFYNVGNKLGIDNIARYAEALGMGRATGVDLPGEAAGVVPSSQWKVRNFREKYYAGETISVSIGQGALTVTPLQLAVATGGIATGGVVMRPHLVKEQRKFEPAAKMTVDFLNINRVIEGMSAVVNGGGTGVRARIPGLEVAGKTGTAQLASNDYLKSQKSHTLKDNAWFVGFAPKQSPEIVVVALFENGEHGNLAAPIVRDVIKAHFDKKARRDMPPELLSQVMLR